MINRILLFTFLVVFNPGLKAQSVTFSWNGSMHYSNGSIQSWTVPPCCSSISITAVGAAGGTSTTHNYAGGLGASLTGTVPVTPGHVLYIMVGGKGDSNTVNDGGGGGTFVWDHTTSTLLVAAGGGGGAGCYAGAVTGGPGANGQTNNTSASALAAPTMSLYGSCANGGNGGGLNSGGLQGLTTYGGPANSSDGGPACGGAGWGENGFNIGAGTFFYANGYGIYPLNGINPGYGGAGYGGNRSPGGYGGGGGGGFNGGGGGGGYNGGGGGNGQTNNNAGWGGGGGGSYFNGGVAASTTVGTSSSNGSVTITFNNSNLTVTANTVADEPCNGDCKGVAKTTVTGGSAPFNYTWFPAGGNGATATGLCAGSYTVTVTDANNCSSTAAVTITQPSILTAMATATTANCDMYNASATITASGGTPAYTYAWTPGSGSTSHVTGLSAGSYSVKVTDSHGCEYDTSITITQPPPMVVKFKADSLAGCASHCTKFLDLSTDPNGSITQWSWNFGDNDTSAGIDPQHCYTNPGKYNVSLTVTDKVGCRATSAIHDMITVYSFPVPSFVMGPQPTTIMDPNMQFGDNSTDEYGPISTWYWNFNDPKSTETSRTKNASHTYSDTGTYCVTLTVSNMYGCKDSITECLVISNNYTLYIPDAFSPNGDGMNDVFQPKGGAIAEFQMDIFDRWGTMLYSTKDINKGWDGSTGGGLILQADTYVYLINVTDNFKKTHSYMGKVTLIK